ncbi:MAG: UDP-N-acetylmuramyl-tripeptide synthetase [bacterium]|nr:UDP-N-acetylmuramyl-tripeptide synthetase [bacterium]
MKEIIKKFIPEFLVSWYHFSLAYLGAFWYGFPSQKMVIIGIAGTRGKTTTANMIWSCLTSAGYKAGQISTANIRIGAEERMNEYHMTMPGRFVIQKLLLEMRNAGCRFAIVETPSEGVEQWRHKGIAYDIVVMTSLYPEYLAVHGLSFERCKKMHERIFAELASHPKKSLEGNSIYGEPCRTIPKTIVVNRDIKERDLFLRHKADLKITFSASGEADVAAKDIAATPGGVAFLVGTERYRLGLLGAFNVPNALAAIAVASALGIHPDVIREGLSSLGTVPGRMEEVVCGQRFRVFVDYAHDAVSIEAVLKAAREIASAGKVILLLGAEGGGRDKQKRPVMGELAAKLADYAIVTNVDPYDDDPSEIIEDIAKGSEKFGKTREKTLFAIEDRKEGIRKAFALAHEGDVVLITGKGAEQSMNVHGKKIPWDDRVITREILTAMS